MTNETKTPKKVAGSSAKAPSESVVQTHINDHEVRLVELEKRLGEAREAVGEFDSRVSRMKNSAEEFINNALQTIPKRFDDLCLRVEKSEKAPSSRASPRSPLRRRRRSILSTSSTGPLASARQTETPRRRRVLVVSRPPARTAATASRRGVWHGRPHRAG